MAAAALNDNPKSCSLELLLNNNRSRGGILIIFIPMQIIHSYELKANQFGVNSQSM